MKKLIALLLLIPSLSYGACRTINFSSTTSNPYEVGSAIPGLGSQYHGSVTNPTFDPLWMRAIDCDDCTLIAVEANGSYKTLETNFCGPSTAAWDSCIAVNARGGYCECEEGPTMYVPWVVDCPYFPGPQDDRAHRASYKYHNIANEPSSPSVAFMDFDRTTPYGGNGSITFSSPYPKYISFWYTGGDTNQYFACESSLTFPTAGSLAFAKVYFYDSNNNQLGQITLNQSGVNLNHSNGDPHGQYGGWNKVEYWNNAGIAKMWFVVTYVTGSYDGEAFIGFYIDDLQVCNTLCPDPPCEFE